jgi:hypothetical protein
MILPDYANPKLPMKAKKSNQKNDKLPPFCGLAFEQPISPETRRLKLAGVKIEAPQAKSQKRRLP